MDQRGKIVEFSEVVPDLDHYNREMGKGFLDKLFFADQIDADVIVDYGCADGRMLGILQTLFPERDYIGFDISEREIERARIAHPNIDFFSDYADVEAALDGRLKRGSQTEKAKRAVVCSSIIHEVLSYGNRDEIETFWRRIFDTAFFDVVVIRDMSVSRTVSRPSDPISVAKIRQRHNPEAIVQFEQQWGTLESNWSLVHFLLKYRYTANWSRELIENYLPINLEALLNRVPVEWTPTFIDHFTLPFARQQIKKDFGIDLQDRTHLKLILEKA
jgi:hypothetical protein